MKFTLRLILYPLALLYGLGVSVRKILYKTGIYKRVAFDIRTVAVGNLIAGGAGKSPFSVMLLQMLREKYRCGLISRGYGRKTKGFRMLGHNDSPHNVGDEPLMIYKYFAGVIPVAVGEDRVLATTEFLKYLPDTELIVYDDAFQHLPLLCNRYIVVTAYDDLFYHDHLLPAGMLREPRHAASRADMVVVTKCPEDIPEEKQQDIRRKVRRYTRADLFFATIDYGAPVLWFGQQPDHYDKVILITGIANPGPLVNELKKKMDILYHYRKPDHHWFTREEILKLAGQYPEIPIFTTEKDVMRLYSLNLHGLNSPVYYVPVQTRIISDMNSFENKIFSWLDN